MNETESPSVHAIVLAAGGSSRFGSPKQFARLGGASLIQRAIAAAAEAVGPRFRVVLGAYAAEIAATLDLPSAQILMNPEWSEGIASSIRVGVAHLPMSCAGVLIQLADQPHIFGASLRRLVDAWHRAPECIIASHFGRVAGAPCVFPRSYFGELGALHGDQGARGLLDRHSARVVRVEHPEAAVDIDTMQQLAEQQRLA